MAVEVEAAGQVDEFIRILRRRIWWIIIPVAVIGSLGTFFAVVVPKKYVVTTKVLVRDQSGEVGELGQASAIEGAVAKINITSPARIESVLTKAKWEDGYWQMTEDERNEYRDDLLKDLRVSTPTMAREADQQLVEITFEHTSAERAFDFLKRLSDDWIKDVLMRHLSLAERERRETADKLQDLVKERQVVVEDLRATRTYYKIPPPTQVDIFKGGAKMASFEQQGELQNKITDLEDKIEELREEIERKEIKAATMDPYMDAAVPTNERRADTRISKIDKEISELEDLVLRNGWSSSHKRAKQIARTIEVLQDQKIKIGQEGQRVQFDSAERVENVERNRLLVEVEDLNVVLDQDLRKLATAEERLVSLDEKNTQLQEAIAKTQLLDRKEEALSEEIGILRQTRTRLELEVSSLKGDEGNPFEILLKPHRPTRPTSPNPWVIAIGSVIFGLALGFGLALLKEYSKSCFRSARELNRVMTHPVLGTVNAIRTRRERARDFLVRSVLGGGSLLFVLSVGYVTWAWANDKESLTKPLVSAIETFQEALK